MDGKRMLMITLIGFFGRICFGDDFDLKWMDYTLHFLNVVLYSNQWFFIWFLL